MILTEKRQILRFLRNAAVELRNIASATPEIGEGLRRIALQLDEEADDIERHSDALQE